MDLGAAEIWAWPVGVFGSHPLLDASLSMLYTTISSESFSFKGIKQEVEVTREARSETGVVALEEFCDLHGQLRLFMYRLEEEQISVDAEVVDVDVDVDVVVDVDVDVDVDVVSRGGS